MSNKEKGRRVGRAVKQAAIWIAVGMAILAVYQRWYLYRYALIIMAYLAIILAPAFLYMMAGLFCHILKKEALGVGFLEMWEGYMETL